MEETLNNQENKMTWPLDISQFPSSATSALAQWVCEQNIYSDREGEAVCGSKR